MFLGPVNLTGFCIVYKVCTFKWLRNVFIVRGTLRKISHPEERMKNLTNKRVGGYTKPPHKFCCHLAARSFHRGVTVRRAARVMTGHSLFFCQLLLKYSNVSHQTGWRGSVVRRSVGGQGVLITTVSREEGCKRPLWLVSIRVARPLTPWPLDSGWTPAAQSGQQGAPSAGRRAAATPASLERLPLTDLQGRERLHMYIYK